MAGPVHGRGGWLLRGACAAAVVIALAAGQGLAEDGADAARPVEAVAVATGQPAQHRGPVTNLPMPRYVSLKVSEGNARRGPSLSHRIDWVFVRRDMPLEITGEYEHWRRVRDRDGAGGWVHYSLLSGGRTVIVTAPMTELRVKPEAGAPLVARAEAGVVARLGTCEPDWCSISAGGQRGWALKSALWGVAPGEVRE